MSSCHWWVLHLRGKVRLTHRSENKGMDSCYDSSPSGFPAIRIIWDCQGRLGGLHFLLRTYRKSAFHFVKTFQSLHTVPGPQSPISLLLYSYNLHVSNILNLAQGLTEIVSLKPRWFSTNILFFVLQMRPAPTHLISDSNVRLVIEEGPAQCGRGVLEADEGLDLICWISLELCLDPLPFIIVLIKTLQPHSVSSQTDSKAQLCSSGFSAVGLASFPSSVDDSYQSSTNKTAASN